MAKTKQTAKKSTGDTAKRQLIGVSTRVLRPRPSRSRGPSHSPQPIGDVEMTEKPTLEPVGDIGVPVGDTGVPVEDTSGPAEIGVDRGDEWCHLCIDGSDLLVICDECGSATCKTCVPGLGNMPSTQLQDQVKFKCVGCTKKKSTFHGLYNLDGSPVFQGGMTVTAHSPANPRKQRVRSPSLIIIEFILKGLPQVGTAGQLLHLSLVQNYVVEPHRLHHEQIPFELSSQGEFETHVTQMAKTVKAMQGRNFDHTVVIVHTHSDNTTGDLWYCSHHTDSGGPAATTISDFFATVIGPEMSAYIRGMKFSSLFLLACGAVVRESEALTGLKATAESLEITDTFAFGAERLITHHPAVWMIGYADQVIVSGQPSRDAIGPLLYSSLVGRHTSVVYLNKTKATDKGVVCSLFQYIWEQGSHRPNTHSYPLACPKCNTISPWQRIGETNGVGFTLTCKAKLRDGGKCPGKWEVPARPKSSAVEAPHVGTWRVVSE